MKIMEKGRILGDENHGNGENPEGQKSWKRGESWGMKIMEKGRTLGEENHEKGENPGG